MDNTEQDIIASCQSGNTERFGELYDRYIRKIYTFIYYKTLHKQTAEDLTSEVFFKALKNIRSVNPEKKFSTWLYAIARNAVIDHYRTFKRTTDIEDAWDVGDDNDLSEKLDDTKTFEKLQKGLVRLSPIQREIVILRIWEDMSYREIADVVGKTEENSKMIFSRSIAKLRTDVLLALLTLAYLWKT
jgi:RNA polymerase sigma-70 factor, ECF subfamily